MFKDKRESFFSRRVKVLGIGVPAWILMALPLIVLAAFGFWLQTSRAVGTAKPGVDPATDFDVSFTGSPGECMMILGGSVLKDGLCTLDPDIGVVAPFQDADDVSSFEVYWSLTNTSLAKTLCIGSVIPALTFGTLSVLGGWDGATLLPSIGANIRYQLDFNSGLLPGEIIDLDLSVQIDDCS